MRLRHGNFWIYWIFISMGVVILINLQIGSSSRYVSITTQIIPTTGRHPLPGTQTRTATSPHDYPMPYNSKDIHISAIPSYRNSTVLPTWIQDYLDWHRISNDIIPIHNDSTTTTAHNISYLIVRCTEQDNKCGGTADRLKPLPFYVALAQRLQRKLLFYWHQRPCALEHFLVPADIDWRVPDHLHQQIQANQDRVHLSTRRDLSWILQQPNTPLQRQVIRQSHALPQLTYMVFQSHDHGAAMYQEMHPIHTSKNDTTGSASSFDEVFAALWKAFFRPSPPVQARIEATTQKLGLQANQYVGVHIRSQYHSPNGPKMLRVLSQHAMDCASLLRTNFHQPFYVATDDPQATREAVQYAQEQGAKAVSLDENILHLDRGTSFLAKNQSQWTKGTSPAAYYATFVDMYLLAQASCRSVNVGNYGKWANLLSNDPTCMNNHLKLKRCVWKSFA